MVRKYQPFGGKYGNPPSKDRSGGGGGGRQDGGRSSDRGREDQQLSVRSKGRGRQPSPRRKDGKDSGSSSRGKGGKPSTPPDAGAIKSRREISLVTMNLTGSSLMGLTPKYKVNLIEQFLNNFPEVVFIQVG